MSTEPESTRELRRLRDTLSLSRNELVVVPEHYTRENELCKNCLSSQGPLVSRYSRLMG